MLEGRANVANRETIHETTLCAAVTCVFETLAHQSGTRSTLDQAVAVAERAAASTSGRVRTATYEAATRFFEAFGAGQGGQGEMEEGGVRWMGRLTGVEAFSFGVMGMLFGPTRRLAGGAEAETSRAGRAGLALAFFRSALGRPAVALGSGPPIAAAIEADLAAELATERSGPVRALLQRALAAASPEQARPVP